MRFSEIARARMMRKNDRHGKSPVSDYHTLENSERGKYQSKVLNDIAAQMESTYVGEFQDEREDPVPSSEADYRGRVLPEDQKRPQREPRTLADAIKLHSKPKNQGFLAIAMPRPDPPEQQSEVSVVSERSRFFAPNHIEVRSTSSGCEDEKSFVSEITHVTETSAGVITTNHFHTSSRQGEKLRGLTNRLPIVNEEDKTPDYPGEVERSHEHHAWRESTPKEPRSPPREVTPYRANSSEDRCGVPEETKDGDLNFRGKSSWDNADAIIAKYKQKREAMIRPDRDGQLGGKETFMEDSCSPVNRSVNRLVKEKVSEEGDVIVDLSGIHDEYMEAIQKLLANKPINRQAKPLPLAGTRADAWKPDAQVNKSSTPVNFGLQRDLGNREHSVDNEAEPLSGRDESARQRKSSFEEEKQKISRGKVIITKFKQKASARRRLQRDPSGETLSHKGEKPPSPSPQANYMAQFIKETLSDEGEVIVDLSSFNEEHIDAMESFGMNEKNETRERQVPNSQREYDLCPPAATEAQDKTDKPRKDTEADRGSEHNPFQTEYRRAVDITNRFGPEKSSSQVGSLARKANRSPTEKTISPVEDLEAKSKTKKSDDEKNQLGVVDSQVDSNTEIRRPEFRRTEVATSDPASRLRKMGAEKSILRIVTSRAADRVSSEAGIAASGASTSIFLPTQEVVGRTVSSPELTQASRSFFASSYDYLKSLANEVDTSELKEFINDLNTENLKAFASDVNSELNKLPGMSQLKRLSDFTAMSEEEVSGLLEVLKKDLDETTTKGSEQTDQLAGSIGRHFEGVGCMQTSCLADTTDGSLLHSESMGKLSKTMNTTHKKKHTDWRRRNRRTEHADPQTFIVPLEMQEKAGVSKHEGLYYPGKDDSIVL